MNRASAESMNQPTLKKMTRRQRTVRHILRALIDKQLEEARRAGRIGEGGGDVPGAPALDAPGAGVGALGVQGRGAAVGVLCVPAGDPLPQTWPERSETP